MLLFSNLMMDSMPFAHFLQHEEGSGGKTQGQHI